MSTELDDDDDPENTNNDNNIDSYEGNNNDTVDDLRLKGNHEFQVGNLDNAVALYSAAIAMASQHCHDVPSSCVTTTGEGDNAIDDDNDNPCADDDATAVAAASDASLEWKNALIVNLCNRSACYFQMESYEQANVDAEQAWVTSGRTNVKAAYRLAKTLIALREYESAISTLQTAMDGGSRRTLSDKERQPLRELMQHAKTQQQQHATQPAALDETTIRGAQRNLSIREFIKGRSLGVGNFSEIIVVTHRVTNEQFALKVLEKKAAADLAKRQHPNVYNEIAMEARVLMERLPADHPSIITMYAAFQDYNSLYYLMDLHNVNPDLWSQIRYRGKMVGAHDGQIRRWMMQLVDALEHIHCHGIVHRDLKPENVLLDAHNHVVVIDFGTAKDLIQTDLNGPEFVGTPDFMAPEAVTGFSGMPKPGENDDPSASRTDGPSVATAETDLWALGSMAYILHTGSTPFWSPSPYLTFLRIKRGLLPRSIWGIPDDAAWDFISNLMQVKQADRLGAECFVVKDKKLVVAKGYGVLRRHDYFAKVNRGDRSNILPSLQDLCTRACAEMAKKDAADLDVCDQHPPGDGSKHDLKRLSPRQQALVCHVLEKSKVLSGGDETRVLQRFFTDDIDYLKTKVRTASRDFVGLTQMNDDEYKPLTGRGSQDPYATKIEPEPTKIVMLTNPMLMGVTGVTTPEQEKQYLKGWKNCIAVINKKRPKAVVVCAKIIPPKFWKFLARIRDSIPVLWNDGSVHYTFWLNGFQGIILQSSELHDEESTQMLWIREQLEQSRMAKQQLFCFCDCDPADVPPMVMKRLARGRTLCLMGLSNSGDPVDYKVKYKANETLDDDRSVKSTDSQEDDGDNQTMRVYGTTMNGLRWLTVDENEEWFSEFEVVDMPEP